MKYKIKKNEKGSAEAIIYYNRWILSLCDNSIINDKNAQMICDRLNFAEECESALKEIDDSCQMDNSSIAYDIRKIIDNVSGVEK